MIETLKTLAVENGCVSTLLFGEVCDTCDGGAVFKIVAGVIKLLTIGVGIVGVVSISIVGIKYITASGGAEQATKARKRLIQIMIALGCYAILFWFADFLVPGRIMASTLDGSTTSCPAKSETQTTVRTPNAYVLPITSGGAVGLSNGTSVGTSSALLNGTAVSYTFEGEQYVIANTKNSLDTYMGILKKYNVAQDKAACKIISDSPSCGGSERDNDTCLSFAETFVHDMYFGTYTSDWCASQYKRASALQDVASDDLSEVLGRAYEEINNGRPVVILVHYKKSSSRHFVAMVGYRASVASSGVLTKDDLLLLNTNGKLTRAGGEKLEVIRDTHEPNKYRIRVLRESVLRSTQSNVINCS